MEQNIITPHAHYKALDDWADAHGVRKIMLVCGNSIEYQTAFYAHLHEMQQKQGIAVVEFRGFQPNPRYEDILNGTALFRAENCDALIAAGGGSAMDVAKCIKLWCNMQGSGADGSFLTQDIIPNEIPFLAMPTTAGTGSEATRFAVIYYQGKKQSVTAQSCIPETVLMDAECLRTLPLYQKKATMSDALCHAVESFWSVNSTDESKAFAEAAIRAVLEHMEGYLQNTDTGREQMLRAANLAGTAINLTQTTAGHAMCYKITGLYGCSHGHAALLCNRVLFPSMLDNLDKCIDQRGADYLRKTLDTLGAALGGSDAESGAEKLAALFRQLELEIPAASPEQYEILKTSVNPERLKNHPVRLTEETIDLLYHQILR